MSEKAPMISSADITTLDPGQFVVVVRNQAAFEARFGDARIFHTESPVRVVE